MYVLDTNTLIYFFKGIGSVSSFLLNTPPNRIGIPTVVLYELEVGIAKSVSPEKRISQLAAFIESRILSGFQDKAKPLPFRSYRRISTAFFPHILPFFHRIYEDIRWYWQRIEIPGKWPSFKWY
jgi:predicted nucleic acid-binding protein